MSRSKGAKDSIVDDLILALKDPSVLAAISTIIQEPVKAKLAQLHIDLAEKWQELDRLWKEINELKQDIVIKDQEGNNLRQSLAKVTTDVNVLEAYSRANNIIINGLPESYVEKANPVNNEDSIIDASELFINFCKDKKLNIEVHPRDISICHHQKRHARGPDQSAGQQSDDQQSVDQQFRPLLVQFTNRKAKNSRKSLKGQKIYINYHFTPSINKIYPAARRLLKEKKIQGAWS